MNYEIGVYLPTSGNAMVEDVHAWCEPAKGAMKVGFEGHSNNSHYTKRHADTPSEYGWRLYGHQTTLVQCGTYNNHLAANATDNTMVGVKFEASNAIATLVGHYFLGGDASHRLKADIEATDGNYGLVTMTAMLGQNVATVRGRYSRQVGLVAREAVSVDRPTPTAGHGFNWQVGGLARWSLANDGSSEAGSNAGSNLSLKKYADDGTTAEEVLYIAQASGSIVAQKPIFAKGSVYADGPAGTAGLGVYITTLGNKR
jgi:hypothetical protein